MCRFSWKNNVANTSERCFADKHARMCTSSLTCKISSLTRMCTWSLTSIRLFDFAMSKKSKKTMRIPAHADFVVLLRRRREFNRKIYLVVLLRTGGGVGGINHNRYRCRYSCCARICGTSVTSCTPSQTPLAEHPLPAEAQSQSRSKKSLGFRGLLPSPGKAIAKLRANLGATRSARVNKLNLQT